MFNSHRISDSSFVVHDGQVMAYHLDPRQMSGDDENIETLDYEDLPKYDFGRTEHQKNSKSSLPTNFK